MHDKAIATRTPGTSHYHYKNWSAEFRCPVCGHSGRFSLNFLGRRNVVCTGFKFTREAKA